MLNFHSPVFKMHSANNFSMKEKSPVAKINLRGNLETKEFPSKIGKILGIILPKESCSTSSNENVTSLWLGPNEWLIVSNQEISKEGGVYELEQVLFDGISKTNLGAVTNVTDQFTISELSKLPISIDSSSKIGPVSSPSSILIIETPVFVSPFITAH